MRGLHHRGTRIASALLFATLLLVPLVERGHSHANRDLARPCAACIAAHHSPAAPAPLVVVATTYCPTAIAELPRALAPLRRDHSPHSGRAPPSSSLSV